MRTFFKTVAVVTVFSVSEKFLGFLYRIFISRTIGSEGIGIYQVALSVFGLLYTIICSGTPVTVSRLMTKYKAENKTDRVFRVITAGLCFTLAVAVPICLIFFFAGNKFSFLFADERCMSVFMIILPGLIFTSVYAVLRGVFWGNKDFLPYSIIELLEEVCMIVVGILLINRATDIYDGAMRASVAILVSYIFSFTIATAVFFIKKNKLKNPVSEFRPLLSSALPITAMRTANSMVISLVSIILPMRLIAAGYSSNQAMSAFGAAVGQAIPLLFIPTTLIGSFTLVLIPEIAENFYKKKDYYLKRDIEKAIKFTTFVSCLFIPVFTVCGEEIGVIVFDSYECGKYLSASAFLMLFMSISNLTTSMLNSMGLEKRTLIYFIISSVFMLISIWVLPFVMGIYALLVGFTFVFGLTTVLNLVLLNKNCREKPKYLWFLISAAALAIPTSLLGFMLESMLLTRLGTVLTFFILTAIMLIFNAALFAGFGLVSVNGFFNKIKKSLPSGKKSAVMQNKPE